VERGTHCHKEIYRLQPGDALALQKLALKLLEEVRLVIRYPFHCKRLRAYSPALDRQSLFAGMGIKPILERQPTFPNGISDTLRPALLEVGPDAHIRKVAVPVVYTDFCRCIPRSIVLWACEVLS